MTRRDNERPTDMTISITYGDHTLDFSKLPPKSLEAMLKRGVAHYLGNEVASKVSGRKAKAAADGTPLADDEVAAIKAEYVAAALQALNEGTVGVSTRGPAADPIDSEMEKIARAEINTVLKANGAKFQGKGEDRKVTFADGQSFTMPQLIERRLGSPDHGDRIRKEAEKAIKARAKALAAAKSEAPVTEALGL